MDFPPLTKGSLRRRYKRFLADVVLAEGAELVCAHCPNTGAMTDCQPADAAVWLSFHSKPTRKLAWTWELVQTETGLACIHAAIANQVVAEALRKGLFPDLMPSGASLRSEVRLADRSRADFFVDNGSGVYIEVKSVTWHVGAGRGAFPDAVSMRASKHLAELVAAIDRGYRAALVFCVMHEAITSVAPAEQVDPTYAAHMAQAMAEGLEVYLLFNEINLKGIYPLRSRYVGEKPSPLTH
jgi:sugar fermentation stimulation protein A